MVTATSACVPGVTSENSSGIGRLRELLSLPGDALGSSTGVGAEVGWALKMGSGRNAARPVPEPVLLPRGALPDEPIDPEIFGPKSGSAVLAGDRGDRGGLLPGTDLENFELAEVDRGLAVVAVVDEEKMDVADEDADDAKAELAVVPAVLVDAVEVVRLGERWGAADLESEREGDERGGGNDELGTEAAREAVGPLG